LPKESSGPGCHINMLGLLLQFQRLFIPGLILLLLWAIYRTILKKDRPVGLVLFIALIIIVDYFFNTGIYIPGMEQGSIRYSEVICFFLLLQGTKTKPAGGRNNLIVFLTWVYFLLFFYAALRAFTFGNGMNNYRRIIIPQILAAWISYKGFNEQEDYKRFLFFFMFLVIIIGLFVFWDAIFDRWLLHSEMLHKFTYTSDRRQGRFGGFFLNPNIAGGFCVLMLPSMLLLTIRQKTLVKRIFCWGGLLLFLFALIKTESRGPMLGFVLALLFLVVMPTRQFPLRRKIGALIVTILVLSFFLPGFYQAATTRFGSFEKDESEDEVSRLSIWEFTIKGPIADHPFFGIGLGEPRYFWTMIDYGFKDIYEKYPLHNPHSSYLEIAVMSGCITLTVFLWIIGLVLSRNIGFILRQNEHELSLWLLGMTSGMVGFLFCISVDMQMFNPSVAPVFWVILFLSFAISSSNPTDREETLIHKPN